LERLGHLERLDRADRTVDAVFAFEQVPVEQHAHRLDGIKRNALGTPEDARAELVGQAGHEAAEQLAHRLGRKRLDVKGAEPPPAGAPGSPLLGELGTRQNDDEEREAARPLEQVLDEVEQPGVGPLHVLEHKDCR
jgi:hypothetical protein